VLFRSIAQRLKEILIRGNNRRVYIKQLIAEIEGKPKDLQ
jgi:hypothetical protein